MGNEWHERNREETSPSKGYCDISIHSVLESLIYHTGAFPDGGSDSGMAILRCDHLPVKLAYQGLEGWLLEPLRPNPNRGLRRFACNAIILGHARQVSWRDEHQIFPLPFPKIPT